MFCARVGDRHQPQFRYVGYEEDGPVVLDEVLTCLAHAHPDDGSDTERVLSEETLERAYGAWAARACRCGAQVERGERSSRPGTARAEDDA